MSQMLIKVPECARNEAQVLDGNDGRVSGLSPYLATPKCESNDLARIPEQRLFRAESAPLPSFTTPIQFANDVVFSLGKFVVHLLSITQRSLAPFFVYRKNCETTYGENHRNKIVEWPRGRRIGS